MKRLGKTLAAALLAALLALCFALAGCSGGTTYVTQIEKTAQNGDEAVYTVTYSDGSTSTFTVENGKDGSDLTAADLYEEYKAQTGEELTFEEFLQKYLTVDDGTGALAIQRNLLSVMKLYAEFVATETSGSMMPPFQTSVTDTAVSTGSAVIYALDESEDGYTYIVTNYHVVYSEKADEEKNGGSKIARKIYGYLYGSENTLTAMDEDGNGVADRDDEGYTLYDYGSYAIPLEYVGGSVTSDIAVLRTKTENIFDVNESARAVTLASGYGVGEKAVAIGNPEGKGISVTEGIVSTKDEQIALNIDGTARSYRSIRIDTALYEGNSGGGLFNSAGELIGITNAGDGTDQNINYAVPLEIAAGTADNLIYYFEDGNEETQGAYKVMLGVTVLTENSRYVYDDEYGTGDVWEDVTVQSVTAGSIAEQLGLQQGDRLTAITVNGKEHTILRSFDISDCILTMRPNDVLTVQYVRAGAEGESASYTLQGSDFVALA